ncbi:MAG: InlB B-repeat-containing protein [Oscillospiraceae bacterium]|nr:InlB B-repeat-containing protein [Oscillospiraceae bacterium]MBQ6428244.1 InlB B-repeat-containing protein [Oscillospiraceae bacterium]
MKRFFAVLLCLLMCVSMLPIAAFAEDADIVIENDEGDEGEQQCIHENIMYVSEVEPDCKGGHTDYYKCSDCGKLFSDAYGDEEISAESTQLLPKHTKPADEKLIKIISATCTEKGQVKFKCAICGDDVTEYQKKLGHQLTIHPYVEQTCTTDGNYTYYSCDRCGNLYWNEQAEYSVNLSDIVISKGHSLTHVEAVAPTCTAEGNIEYYSCSVCGKLFADETATEEITGSTVLQALGHSLVKVDAKEPTCAENGNAEYWVCLRDGCGAFFEDEDGSIPIDPAEVVVYNTTVSHPLTKVNAKEASCEEAGNTEYWKCDVCSRLFSDADGQAETNAVAITIPALSHQMEETEAKAATCTEDGNIQFWTCSECKKVFSDAAATTAIQQADTVIPHGHQLEKTEARAATCSEEGNIQYWGCKRENCGKLFSDAEGTKEIQLADTVINKTEHKFDGGVCQVCRAEDPDYKGPTLKDSDLNITSGEELVIRVDADFDTTMARNWSITIGGETISKDYIDVSRGSTVFTINGDALKKLDPGKYKVTIKIGDETVEAELVVEEEPTTYNVIIGSISNGTITVDKSTPVAGETVRLTIKPSDGYVLKNASLTVKDSGGTSITVTNNQFTMPAADVTVTAEFVKEFKVSFDTVLPISTVTKPADKKAQDGDTIAASDMPEPEDSAKHHVFKGWYKDKDYKTPFKAGTDTITADTTLYAKWTHDYPHDKKDALEGKGICPYCWEADHSFTVDVIDPDFTAEIVRGNGKTAHYGSYFPMTVNTYYRYVKGSVGVKVDGKTLNSEQYKVFSPKNGTSTVVELDRAYIRQLPVGKYAISIKTDLGTARGFFWVSSSPKTGDDSNVALWVTVGVISAAGAAGIAYYLLKKRKK